MFAVSKKIFLAFVVLATVLTTGAWQSTPVAVVNSQNSDSIETPLYPGLPWSSVGVVSEEIRLNASGDSISLSGEKFEAQVQFVAGVPLPQEVVDYYSNAQLAAAGWESFDAVSGPEGVQYVFQHESGIYLLVEYVSCQDDASKTCMFVWKSEASGTTSEVVPAITSGTDGQTATTATFYKKSPSNGSTNISISGLTLSWSAYSPTPDKYKFCVKEGSTCADNDPNWTSASGTSATPTITIGYNKTYYWQVKAVTCVTCTPKKTVDADNGSWWKFTTKSNPDVVIVGNAGVAGAVLSYVNGSAKTVTASSTGAYSITVPLNWTGTITPSKSGYRFYPTFASFTSVTAPQIIQNFLAAPILTISGNAGLPGAVLSYTDGTPKTVTADSSGKYTITVYAGWNGTVTPSSPGYSFTPPSRTYNNLAANQTAQDYTATFVTFTISGSVGAPGVTVTYTTPPYPGKIITGAAGTYSFVVPQGWTGTITPSHPCYSFSPGNISLTNVQANQPSKSFTANVTNLCVATILQADASPTNAATVHFTVYFTKSVTGVDTGDFALTTAGVTGAAITDVSGSGATYTVTVTTGSGNGTIRLDLIDDGSIQAGGESLNGNFTTGEIYTILKTPTFADVTIYNQYYPDIEVLYANKLTAGCATTPLLKYCPDTAMDRAQGAVFIMRADNGESYVPNPATYQFQDDWTPGPWARDWAEAMREANLTAGCKTSPLLFCPWQVLPREQAVIYGLKLKYGNSYMPPAATGTVFADLTDPTYYATAWAEQAYKDGLIPACGVSGGKPMFCPKATASRGLAAYMIVRAKGLITP